MVRCLVGNFGGLCGYRIFPKLLCRLGWWTWQAINEISISYGVVVRDFRQSSIIL